MANERRPLTRKQITRILTEENTRQLQEYIRQMNRLYRDNPPHVPDFSVRPEEAPNYPSDMPQREVLKEFVRLNYLSYMIPFSRTSPDYLRSALECYDKLIPKIEDMQTKELARVFRERAARSLDREVEATNAIYEVRALVR